MCSLHVVALEWIVTYRILRLALQRNRFISLLAYESVEKSDKLNLANSSMAVSAVAEILDRADSRCDCTKMLAIHTALQVFEGLDDDLDEKVLMDRVTVVFLGKLGRKDGMVIYVHHRLHGRGYHIRARVARFL